MIYNHNTSQWFYNIITKPCILRIIMKPLLNLSMIQLIFLQFLCLFLYLFLPYCVSMGVFFLVNIKNTKNLNGFACIVANMLWTRPIHRMMIRRKTLPSENWFIHNTGIQARLTYLTLGGSAGAARGSRMTLFQVSRI